MRVLVALESLLLISLIAPKVWAGEELKCTGEIEVSIVERSRAKPNDTRPDDKQTPVAVVARGEDGEPIVIRNAKTITTFTMKSSRHLNLPYWGYYPGLYDGRCEVLQNSGIPQKKLAPSELLKLKKNTCRCQYEEEDEGEDKEEDEDKYKYEYEDEDEEQEEEQNKGEGATEKKEKETEKRFVCRVVLPLEQADAVRLGHCELYLMDAETSDSCKVKYCDGGSKLLQYPVFDSNYLRARRAHAWYSPRPLLPEGSGAVQLDFRGLGKDLGLDFIQTIDAGSKDPGEVRVFEGTQNNFAVSLLKLDFTFREFNWSHRYHSLDGKLVPVNVGRSIGQTLSQQKGDKSWRRGWVSRLVPRAVGLTAGLGLGGSPSKDVDSAIFYFSYGLFVDLLPFLGVEFGGVTGVATSGDFSDRTDSAVYWGARFDVYQGFDFFKDVKKKLCPD